MFIWSAKKNVAQQPRVAITTLETNRERATLYTTYTSCTPSETAHGDTAMHEGKIFLNVNTKLREGRVYTVYS